jgi:hypothetical protein
MSSARGRASRRDDNEPEIRKRFAAHGWHTEALSAAGMPDLLAYPPRPSLLGFTQVKHVDVKGAKGKSTPAQREKWTALSEKGIPVYVCRNSGDVDALVAGNLQPWAPWEDEVRRMGREAKRARKEEERAPDTAGELDALLREAGMQPYFHVKGCKGPPCACPNRRTATRPLSAGAAYMRQLAEAEEALIPERARAELKRRASAQQEADHGE